MTTLLITICYSGNGEKERERERELIYVKQEEGISRLFVNCSRESVSLSKRKFNKPRCVCTRFEQGVAKSLYFPIFLFY